MEEDACTDGCPCPGVHAFGAASELVGMAASDGSRVLAVMLEPGSYEPSLSVLDMHGDVIATPALRYPGVTQLEPDGSGGFYVLGSANGREFKGIWLDHWSDTADVESLDLATSLATSAEINDFLRIPDRPFVAPPRGTARLAIGRAWSPIRFDIWHVAAGNPSPIESSLWVEAEELNGELREYEAIDARIVDLMVTDERIQVLVDVPESAAWPERLVLVSRDTEAESSNATARVCAIGRNGGAVLLGLDTVAYLGDQLRVDASGCRGVSVDSLTDEHLGVLRRAGTGGSELLGLSARDDALGVLHFSVGADHQAVKRAHWSLPGTTYADAIQAFFLLGSDSVLALDHDAQLRRFDGSLRDGG